MVESQQRSEPTAPRVEPSGSGTEIWSIIVAAGKGSRFGSMKQLQWLGDKRLIDWSIEAFSSLGPVVVVGPMGSDPASYFNVDTPIQTAVLSKVTRFVSGGDSRSASVRAGLGAVDKTASHILIHDAARPLVRSDLVGRVVAALEAGADGAIPVVPIVDTLCTVDGLPVDRSRFVAVQTPQGFTSDALRDAHAGGGIATDDATLVSEAGGDVVHVAGEVDNLKITIPRDLEFARAMLALSAEQKDGDSRGGEAVNG